VPENIVPFGLDCLDFFYPRDPQVQQDVWDEHKTAIMKKWIAKSPGTRPWSWWKWEAQEPRKRIGGKGTPAHDTLAYGPEWSFGIPVLWNNVKEGKLYKKLGIKTKSRYIAIDEKDLPTYESEAFYLRRLDLLGEAEKKKLTAKDFKDEEI